MITTPPVQHGQADRGGLPQALQLARRVGPWTVGRVLQWDARSGGYGSPGVSTVIPASVARVGLGVDFLPVPTQQELEAMPCT